MSMYNSRLQVQGSKTKDKVQLIKKQKEWHPIKKLQSDVDFAPVREFTLSRINRDQESCFSASMWGEKFHTAIV